MIFNTEIIKRGYFILYRHEKGLFGNLIYKKQLEYFSHEHAIYTHIEVSGGGEYSINIAPPRSKLVDITKKHKGRYIAIRRYKNEDYEKGGRHAVGYFSAALCANIGYDFRGILAFMFKWISNNNRLYFCSEGSAKSLQMKYPSAFYGRKPDKIMPADFLASPEFETVWQGRIPK